jgi:hypothetical protein
MDAQVLAHHGSGRLVAGRLDRQDPAAHGFIVRCDRWADNEGHVIGERGT